VGLAVGLAELLPAFVVELAEGQAELEPAFVVELAGLAEEQAVGLAVG